MTVNKLTLRFSIKVSSRAWAGLRCFGQGWSVVTMELSCSGETHEALLQRYSTFFSLLSLFKAFRKVHASHIQQ